MVDYRKLLSEFIEDEWNPLVRRAELAPLGSVERLTLEMFADWLNDRTRPKVSEDWTRPIQSVAARHRSGD